MFRKHYKDANDSIKPDDAFVNSVIENALKRRPPLLVRHAKQISTVAAAVIVVSGAVVSMSVWERTDNNTDGVVVYETATDSGSKEAPTPTASAPQRSVSPPKKEPSPILREAEKKTAEKDNAEEEKIFTDITTNVTAGDTTEDAAVDTAQDADEFNGLKTEVAGVKKFSALDKAMDSAPRDMTPYVAASGASAIPESGEVIDDSDIPVPTGYYCISATPNGYTFANDTGGIITVTVNYGGEERDPYIEENGDNIYAVFTSFGLSVTVNAAGAEKAAVEEIINSLR